MLARCSGFGASIAVVLLAAGTLALSLSVLSSAVAYSDGISHREMRMQEELDREACLESAKLAKVKDAFAHGRISFSEFGCSADL